MTTSHKNSVNLLHEDLGTSFCSTFQTKHSLRVLSERNSKKRLPTDLTIYMRYFFLSLVCLPHYLSRLYVCDFTWSIYIILEIETICVNRRFHITPPPLQWQFSRMDFLLLHIVFHYGILKNRRNLHGRGNIRKFSFYKHHACFFCRHSSTHTHTLKLRIRIKCQLFK